jgi:Icc-related predicted phosphoesterase
VDSDFAVHFGEGKKVILCVADTHGLIPAGHFTGGKNPDALFLLGDLGCTEGEVLRCHPEVAAFGVAGNHDPDDPFDAPGARRVFDLHGRAVMWDGIIIGGLGGCLRYRPGRERWLFTEEEYEAVLAGMPAVDILISHCAPAGCWPEGRRFDGGFYDAYAGSEALRDYILRAKPKLVVHGLLHRRGVTVLGSTVVQAVYGWELVGYSPWGPVPAGEKETRALVLGKRWLRLQRLWFNQRRRRAKNPWENCS